MPFSGASAYGAPWIVGIAFLNGVYSVFRADPPSVGFAELSQVAREWGNDDHGYAPLPSPSIDGIAASVTGSGKVGSAIYLSPASWWIWGLQVALIVRML